MAESTDLELALDRAGEARDSRGLIPLDRARTIVEGATVFDGADDERARVWAALLSLEDAHEFVRHARRLRWRAEPTPPDDVAAFERFGNAVLGWPEAATRDRDLAERPETMLSCLLEVGTPRAFDLLFDVESVGGDRADAQRLLREWIEVHPKLGLSLLAERAERGGIRARQLLRHLANLDPIAVADHLAASRGREDTDALLDALCVVRELTEASIVAVFDMAAEGEIGTPDHEWPMFHSKTSDANVYHAMRLVAVRSRTDNRWGVVIERIAGSTVESGAVEAYRYGSHVEAGRVADAVLPLGLTVTPVTDDAALPCRVEHATGSFELTDDDVGRLGLKQKGIPSLPRASQAFIYALRAVLAEHPRAFRRPAETIAALVAVDDPEVILDTDDYTHVVGTTAEVATRRDRFWAARPGDTRVFRSLARAIAERDPGLFRPGKPNLDWREHPLPRHAPNA